MYIYPFPYIYIYIFFLFFFLSLFFPNKATENHHCHHHHDHESSWRVLKSVIGQTNFPNIFQNCVEICARSDISFRFSKRILRCAENDLGLAVGMFFQSVSLCLGQLASSNLFFWVVLFQCLFIVWGFKVRWGFLWGLDNSLLGSFCPSSFCHLFAS